jgi:hypothetical protein
VADFRYIRTSIWKDEWFVSLRGDEQRLFLYLLSNGQTNMLGIYPISLREIAFDTGLDQEEVKRIFRDRLSKDGKAYFELGWVVMKNWLKHQTLNGNMLTSVEQAFNQAPVWLRRRVLKKGDSLYIPLESLLKRSKAFQILREIEVEGEIEIEVRRGKGNGKPSAKDGSLKGDAVQNPLVWDIDAMVAAEQEGKA